MCAKWKQNAAVVNLRGILDCAGILTRANAIRVAQSQPKASNGRAQRRCGGSSQSGRRAPAKLVEGESTGAAKLIWRG